MSGHSSHRNPTPVPDFSQPVQRSFASQLREHDPLFHTYEHLQGLARGDEALTMLRKVSSLVKPLMRKRGWKVSVLAEFLPPEANLLGLNINRGHKICLRLRYHNYRDLFLPVEQVVDTMLHELAHNVYGPHDGQFHRLWDELRDEHDVLVSKGFTGAGFLSQGQRLGGGGGAQVPVTEMRRVARASAERRHAQGKLTKSPSQLPKASGHRLGGKPLDRGRDRRQVIAEQASRRNSQNATINTGCGSGRRDAGLLSDQSHSHSFRTRGEEDDANDRAIAQALYELIEEDEEQKLLRGTLAVAPAGGGLAWHPANGLYDPRTEPVAPGIGAPVMSEEEQLAWAMQESLRPAPLPPPPGTRSSGTRSAPPVLRPAKHAAPPPPLVIDDDHDEERELHFPLIDLSDPFDPTPPPAHWACAACTCVNPREFLACDACGAEKSSSSAAAVAAGGGAGKKSVTFGSVGPGNGEGEGRGRKLPRR